MTDLSTVSAQIAGPLRDAGLRGRGPVWRLSGSQVQWVIHIDQVPYGNRLGVDVGLDLQVQTSPRRPTDCPILLHLENMPPAKDLRVLMALDLNSALDSDQRRQQLENAGQELARYISERLTLDEVRAAYRAGEFDSGFILRDVRAVLEAEQGGS